MADKRPWSKQRADLYEVIDRVAQKLIDEGQEKATVRFGKLTAKADVKKGTLMRNDMHYRLDDKPGLSYKIGKGKVVIRPEPYKQGRQERGNWQL